MARSLKAILYVDDEPDIRAIVQMALELTPGLTVRTAASGEQAIEEARRLPPDLALVDVMMPGLDGPGTLARMRADAALSGIPVIFMTAKAMPAEVERFLRMGAIGVIAKPFDPMQLGTQVSMLWNAGSCATEQPARSEAAVHRVQEQRVSLASKFIARTRGEIATLSTLIGQWQSGAASALPDIEHLAHRIHGTGATLGFDAISECAGALEHAAKRFTAEPAAPGAADLQTLTERLAREVDAAAAQA